jgi:pimeloyl-ACP methyl ester carboxylesterase
METVISRDGTPIAYHRTGDGPPLLLVHGAANSSSRYSHLLPVLSAEFTVLTMDRRGRGDSGDAECYTFEREFEDVAAVIDSLDEPVNVYGHSIGGTCVLEASLLTNNIDKLILYEPDATPPGGSVEVGDLTARLYDLLDAGDREGLLAMFLSELLGMSDEEVEQYRQLPTWPMRIAAAHTLPRELEAAETYRFHAKRFADMRVPTMLLMGGDSPPILSDGVKVVEAALPNSHVVVMPGQEHVADIAVPDLFVREILSFLRD